MKVGGADESFYNQIEVSDKSGLVQSALSFGSLCC